MYAFEPGVPSLTVNGFFISFVHYFIGAIGLSSFINFSDLFIYKADKSVIWLTNILNSTHFEKQVL